MNRRMLPVLITAALVIALALGGRQLYRVLVTDQIMDRDGMENPDAAETPPAGDADPETALQRAVAGVWRSSEGFTLTLGTDGRAVLTAEDAVPLEGQVILSDTETNHTAQTEFWLGKAEVTAADGTVLGRISALYYQTAEELPGGRLVMDLLGGDGTARSVEFERASEDDSSEEAWTEHTENTDKES